MVKVYLPSFAICTLSLSINLLVLGICQLPAVAQEVVLQTNSKQGDNVNFVDAEPEILAEINRVRTNPQGYAHWLEDQKQYYDQIWLKLPGEKPIRAHRLERAIDEAIAVLKEQKPLPALSSSEQTTANATQKLEDFASANRNIQNISYGRITPQGIVMSLVVDELFPDRRRRKNLLSPNVEDTGVVCQNDPRYAKVCAIAYSNPEVDSTAQKQPETEAIVSQPKTPPPVETETTPDKPVIPETVPEAVEKPETTTRDTEVAMEALPQPPQPQVPPAPSELPGVDLPTSETEKPLEEDEDATEVTKADLEEELASEENEEESAEAVDEENVEEESAEVEEENEDLEDEEELASEEDEEESAEVENEEEEEIADDEDKEEIFEAEKDSEDIEEQVATNSDASQLLENVERGTLEDGDRIIAEDGSFYDSYPLNAKSGESFTISLESDEFDAFVALIDAKGNIIEQNDDISEEDSNSRIRVTIPENGTYNVIVNAYDEGGSGQYVLTVNR